MYVDIWHWKDPAIEAWRGALTHILQRMLTVGREVGLSEHRKEELVYALHCATNDKQPKTEGRAEYEITHSTYLYQDKVRASTSQFTFNFEMNPRHQGGDRDKPIIEYPVTFKIRIGGNSCEDASDAIRNGAALTRLGKLAIELETYLAVMALPVDRIDEAKVAAHEARSTVYWPISQLPADKKALLKKVLSEASPDTLSFNRSFDAKERKLLKDLTKWIKVTHVRKSNKNPDARSWVELTKEAKKYLTYEAETKD